MTPIMTPIRRIAWGVAALLCAAASSALAEVVPLPGASFRATLDAQDFLDRAIEGRGYAAALARAYQERAAYEASYGVDGDNNWTDATAFIAKAKAALEGAVIRPWDPAQFGLIGPDLDQSRAATLRLAAENAATRPEGCARMMAFYDHWLEARREGDHSATPAAAMAAGWRRAYLQCAGGAAIYGFPLGGCAASDRDPDAPRPGLRQATAARAVAAELGWAETSGFLGALGVSRIVVSGHSAAAGQRAESAAVARCRAVWMADLLVANGVAPARIWTEIVGAPTDNEAERYRNRRVTLTLTIAGVE